jgi:hypothetical protein
MSDPKSAPPFLNVPIELGKAVGHLTSPGGRKALGVVMLIVLVYRAPEILTAIAALMDAARKWV